jgi:hypothetical protein
MLPRVFFLLEGRFATMMSVLFKVTKVYSHMNWTKSFTKFIVGNSVVCI